MDQQNCSSMMDPNLALIDKLQNRVMALTGEVREANEKIAHLQKQVEELTADNELLENIAWTEKD